MSLPRGWDARLCFKGRMLFYLRFAFGGVESIDVYRMKIHFQISARVRFKPHDKKNKFFVCNLFLHFCFAQYSVL